jgi:GT2 family glycosyltransferase
VKLVAGIVNYHRTDDVLECVRSLRSGNLVPDRIVVVDNESVPQEASRIESAVGAGNVLASRENRGYAGGANAVLGAAREATFILVLNPDVRVSAGFCAELVRAAEQDPRAAALTGKLLRPQGNVIDTTGVGIRRNGRSFDRGTGSTDDGRYDLPEEVFGASGAAILLRREAMEDLRIDGEVFDEDFFLYHEDNDLCWRARLLGWKVLYVPAAVATHERGYTLERRASASRVVRRHAFRNHYLKLIKNLLPAQVWRDGLHLATWELARLGHASLREPFLLTAYAELLTLIPRAWRKRRVIMSRRRVTYPEIARWFV